MRFYKNFGMVCIIVKTINCWRDYNMRNDISIITISINSREDITFDRCKLLEVLRKYSWSGFDEFRKHARFEDYDYILQNYQECVVKFEDIVAEQTVIK